MDEYNKFDALVLLVQGYFDMLDTVKKFPNAGFAKHLRGIEKKLRDVVKAKATAIQLQVFNEN